MGRRRGLTPEDRELWSRVARTTTPLHRAAIPSAPDASPAASEAAARKSSSPKPRLELPPGLSKPGNTARLPSVGYSRAPSPAEALATHPLRMDQKTHRQMTRGKLRPEARLDLHGMTLAQAGPELANFILSCHARGFRLLLVITGKGSRAADEGPLPTRPGALRHQVPHWLHSAPLSRVVQQVVPAHLRHGGTGAYYVYLRR
ncbi:DNA mismatch repair protein MutS [Paracoccus aurantiacus]|uniref:DNA mismatch repair protein MutS n=1 Tax=Paracoccus aurantiacus TaxID=2599412 RepID=A0A5C6S1U3_9RHOB|nr:Smr/MutS family protein [Paracoccus aurantiacus]TXB67820.1 DNA mismatch repair protein MutS [Paracoccus aurantiacus]